MDSPRAVTKILLPGKRGTLLCRPRLTNFLLEHIDRKLLLVSASAGYGKTSLLIDFAHETTLPVCWYSLDSSDSDPHTFLEYLIFSIQRHFPDFGKRTLALLAHTPLVRDLDSIVGTLVTEMYEDISDYFVLVLDDYQTVEDSDSVNQILDALLRLLPENAHLIVSGRTMPTRITLTRLAARQEIAGLGVNDLRFTTAEIQGLVAQTYHQKLSESQAAELAQHSEGWITGILLTTHSLWKGLFQDLVRLQGSQVHVFNYLASEVFGQQPREIQRFLLDSSVLNHMNADLCCSILEVPKAQDLLQQLEQRNLFVTRLEEDVAWYRYHHLFRDYLQCQLKTLDLSRWNLLHLRAASHFESQHMSDQAIPHYIQAGAFSEAAQAIVRTAKEAFDSGRWTTLLGWIESLPSGVLDSSPKLIVWKARILGDTGRIPQALTEYSRALVLYEASHDQQGIGKTLVRQAVCLRFQGKYTNAIQDCERALQLLPTGELNEIAEAHRTIGIASGLIGDLDRGVQELEMALRLYEEGNDLSNAARVHQDLGVACRTAGRRDADGHFTQALDFWRRVNNPSGLANTLNSIGVTHHREGKYAQAVEILEQALSFARQSGQMRIEAVSLASLGDVYRDRGEFSRAEQAYRSAFAIAQQINESFVITYVLIALGMVFRLAGDIPAAEQVLRDAVSQASSHQSKYEIGLAKTEQGVLYFKQGDTKSAVEELKQASEMLNQVGARTDCARAHAHLARIYHDQRQFRDMTEHLEQTAELGRKSGEKQFLVCEAKELSALLRFAVSKKIGDGYFRGVLEQIDQCSKNQAQQLSPGDKQPPTIIVVCAFGTGNVQVGGRLISRTDWDSANAKELFFLLLAHPQGLRKEKILTALWSEVPPAKANGIFHSTAWRMRRALGRECILYHNGVYKVNPDSAISYDVGEFLDLLQKATEETDPDAKTRYYQSALSLYRDDYFEDSYSDWCIPIRTDLQDRFLKALAALARLYYERGEKELAIETYERLLRKDCYREDIYRQVMRVQLQLGNRAEARRTFDRCRQSMDDAHLDLSGETKRLGQEIRGA